MKSYRVLFAGLLALPLSLTACTVAPAYGPGHIETVRVAPPPPNVEIVGPSPVVGHVWIDGYWHWGGARYVWVPGRWEAPRPGHYWVPHRWERRGHYWHRHGGHWAPEPHRYR